MKKIQIIILFIAAILSWYGMMAVHEAGHCFGAIVTGAKIEAVEIPIIGFSRTDFSGGNSPFFVVLAGPLFGVLIPLILLLFIKNVSNRIKHVLQFFVGFCLSANGAYLGMDAFLRGGDCRQLVQFGSPVWILVSLGMISFGCGLYLWHRMGPFHNWFAESKTQNIEGKAVPA